MLLILPLFIIISAITVSKILIKLPLMPFQVARHARDLPKRASSVPCSAKSESSAAESESAFADSKTGLFCRRK